MSKINHLLIYQPFLYVSSVYHLSTYHLPNVYHLLTYNLSTIYLYHQRQEIPSISIYHLSLSSKLKTLPQRRSKLVIFYYGSCKTNWFYKLPLLLCYFITLLLSYFGQMQFHREFQGETLGWLLSFYLQSSLLMFTLVFSSSLTLFKDLITCLWLLEW